MAPRKISWVTSLAIFLCSVTLSLAGEVYRWTDEEGTVHFTDDASRIPPHYSDRIDKLEVPETVTPETKTRESPAAGEDRVRKYLEDFDRKIETKRELDQKAFDLEEELKHCEARLKAIEDFEKEYYYYFIPYRDPKTGNFVALGSPYHDEKLKLERRVADIKKELSSLREAISKIQRSL